MPNDPLAILNRAEKAALDLQSLLLRRHLDDAEALRESKTLLRAIDDLRAALSPEDK